MKAEIIEKGRNGKIIYPCIMKHKKSNFIVLFYKEAYGISLIETDLYDVGEAVEAGGMEYFEKFEGRLILEND